MLLYFTCRPTRMDTSSDPATKPPPCFTKKLSELSYQRRTSLREFPWPTLSATFPFSANVLAV